MATASQRKTIDPFARMFDGWVLVGLIEDDYF